MLIHESETDSILWGFINFEAHRTFVNIDVTEPTKYT